MNILILVGSYRKNGNTDHIVRLVGENLRKTAAEAGETLELETLYLGQMNIGACRGCRACFDRGEAKCPVKDDILMIKEKMIQADGILVASPVYVDDVSGITKNWIDRLAHLCHRPELAGKCVYLVATVGSTPTGRTLGTLRSAFNTWGACIIGQSGFKTGALMEPELIKQKYQDRAEKIARQFFGAIKARRFARPAFLSLMTFKIQQRYWQRNADDSFDYRYWQGRGWVERSCTYYIPHESSPVKVALARLAGTLVARFVS